MPRKKTTVAPIPQGWLDAVIPLLREGSAEKIHWTGRAQRDMADVGLAFKHQAYELCLVVLTHACPIGEEIFGMLDETDGSLCETWAFLCPHPLDDAEYVYAKIGLHQGRLHINLFSLHADLSGGLKAAIRKYLTRKP
jgi:hypothetical protein